MKKQIRVSKFTTMYSQKGYGAAWADLMIRQVMADGGKEGGKGKAYKLLTEMQRLASNK